ncbi:MAG: helix-turn-helix domain-containing protein [Candidatus Omnitrophica bacterium]|nr:helix-turn-helix domain-containing protein [Candidatus Omnitrophota bacterium]
MAMEFLTPNELSRILKLHPFTITRLAREKKLPGFKVGGSWRFRKDEFERWVEQQDHDRGRRRKQQGVTGGHSN